MLTSVNTPDYPASEWVVNPDLTAVAGVPQKYWAIDTQTIVDQQMIGVEEDDVTPIYETVTTYVDTLRPMTAEEIGAYDLVNPEVPSFTMAVCWMVRLAYFDVTEQQALAINNVNATFALDTKGARNCYLDYQGQNGIDSGFVLPNDSLLREVSVSFKKYLSAQVTVFFRDTVTKSNLAAVVINSGLRTAVVKLDSTRIDATSISCYLESTSNVASPIVTATFSQCN